MTFLSSDSLLFWDDDVILDLYLNTKKVRVAKTTMPPMIPPMVDASDPDSGLFSVLGPDVPLPEEVVGLQIGLSGQLS